jgi:transcriptional regulator with PAS, ATPase and Fis domain
LLRGSSGTGKEWLARGIHGESGRESFLAVNCAAVPENLLESELFGHERGAYPGAHQVKLGVLEQAASGTVFLDEIGELHQPLQVKLLRVLQEKELVRVGGSHPIRISARIIAATHRNLEEEVKSGDFREDLYFRLNVFPIFIPSLHERLEDFPTWVDHFLTKFGHTKGVEEGVVSRLMEYSWPGNLRELENCLERAAIVAAGRTVRLADFPDPVRQKQPLACPSVFILPPTGVSLDEVEKNLILQALEMTKGNKTRAALLLGITRRALYSKMHTHRIRGSAAPEPMEGTEAVSPLVEG